MGKRVPSYILEEQQEIKAKEAYKLSLVKKSFAKKINKVSNLELLDFVMEDVRSNLRDVVDTLYKSNPSYEFWVHVNTYSSYVTTNIGILKFLKEIVEITDNFLNEGTNWYALQHLYPMQSDFVRPLETWEPKFRNGKNILGTLLKHVLAKYPVPSYLEKSFSTINEPSGVLLYQHIGAGDSLKKFTAFPKGMHLPQKALVHLQTTPSDLQFFESLRRAQVLYLGGDNYIFTQLMRSNILRSGESLLNEEFWLSVMKFFVDNPMIEPRKISEIIDYIRNMKFERHRQMIDGVAQWVDPPQPNFTMKGRNPQSLLNQSDEWHDYKSKLNKLTDRLVKKRGREEDYKWDGIRVNDYKIRKGEDNTYHIIQLTSYYQLVEEGKTMHNCVASYASACLLGRTSIFSVRLFVKGKFNVRTATVEVRGSSVVQVRAKFNKKPDDVTINVIKDWAEVERLQMAKYAL